MRTVTAIAISVVLVGLGAAVLYGVSGGLGADGELTERWVSDTGRPGQPNHHAPAANVVRGQGMVYAPISAPNSNGQCDLVALYANNGSKRWNYPIPRANCTIHSVADPTVADYDDDGIEEVFVATTEEAVIGLNSLSGDVEFRQNLTSYGYTQPIVTDLTGDGSMEVIAVDVKGAVSVFRPNGTVVWKKQFETYTWGQPRVADFDGDGNRELVVGLGETGAVYLFESDGTVAWNRSNQIDGSITWMATGQADDDAGVEVTVATTEGVVAVMDGRDGTVQWRRDLGTLAAVHAFGDGDGDGETEVYAVAQDAKLRSYTASNGTVEWTTTLTTEGVQMTPPPSLGDVDGDGALELVAVTNNGIVSIVDPRSGEILDSYNRDVPIWVHPTLADVNEDSAAEVFVIYGDGRVVAFSSGTD
jgi:outer membrane protein assembly factor BamB